MKNPKTPMIPVIDHGVDIIGDEWDVDIPEESLKQREQRKGYALPVKHERRSDNIHSGVVRNNSDYNSDKQSEGLQTTPEKV